MQTFKQYSNEMQKLDEVFNNPYPWKRGQGWSSAVYLYTFKTDTLQKGEVVIENVDDGIWDVNFSIDDSDQRTGMGDQFRIFGTVADIVTKFLDNPPGDVDEFFFSGSKTDSTRKDETGRSKTYTSRVRLYKRFAEMLKKRYKFNKLKIDSTSMDVRFSLQK